MLPSERFSRKNKRDSCVGVGIDIGGGGGRGSGGGTVDRRVVGRLHRARPHPSAFTHV